MLKKGATPIAIVGMAFRFPGDLSDEQAFWQALCEGRDLVGNVDPERWSTSLLQHPKRSEPGRSVTFAAGVLSRIDEFDANFFGISPREATQLDPQQRLLLELAWEAMENGGIVPSRLAGSDCSVYVGISGLDYGMRIMDDLSSMSAHTMTGNVFSMAANRISYAFDLRGPSLAVDTACSSSLVALHHACNSLRSGESSVAMVGGVNLLLHPYPFIGFTKASMLSAGGRCRAFDAAGDGYVRAEGGAMFLLKRLDQAISDGDNIQAVVLASGVNSDGSRKSGITIPSTEGQADLMRAVLQRSGLSSGDVDYVEAHGTGTAVGDPIETAAIGEVYGRSHPAGQPLPIGSVKTNLGHLESASGMAGLVKAVLILKNRALPASLHFETPNPHIDFKALNLNVVDRYTPLSKTGGEKMVVGVNSFGFGGTNAHLLLQEFNHDASLPEFAGATIPPLFLSAQTSQALRDLSARYAELLQQNPAGYYDIAYGAAFARERLEKRLALTAFDAAEMAERLVQFSRGQSVPQSASEDALVRPGGVAFIYSGNGSQWLGMGQRLMAESPEFAALMAELDDPIHAKGGFSIIEQLNADSTQSRLNETIIAQPLLFAIQVALTTLLRKRGVEPQAVAGHSVGEVTAAWAAGALNLEQAIEVICVRSAFQELTRGSGRMAVLGLSETAALELIAAEKLDEVEIAGINSPGNVTLSGNFEQLERLGRTMASGNVFFRMLDLDYAFHSRAMDQIEQDLVKRLAQLAPVNCGAPVFVSTVTGGIVEGSTLTGRYWGHNIRQPVRFAQAMFELAAQGCRVFVEIGPHAILQRYMSECLGAQDIAGRVLPTLLRDNDGRERIDEAVLRILLLLDKPKLETFFPEPGRHGQLPNYPWQREHHWRSQTSEGYNLIARPRVHPLLGWRLKDTTAAWENVLDTQTYPWLADHKVAGGTVLPGAAYVEMALAAAREHFGGTCQELEQLDIIAPIVFDGEHARSLRLELSVRDGSFQIRSRQRLSEDEWAINAVGRLLGAPGVAAPVSADRDVQGGDDAVAIDHDVHYELTSALGLEYGPCFRGLESAEVHGQTLTARIALPMDVADNATQFILHPALLDVCFQSLVGFFKAEIEAGQGMPLLPVKVGHLSLYADTPIVQFRAHLKRRSARSVQADFDLMDATGQTVAVLAGCRFRAAVVRRGHAEPMSWKIQPLLKPLASEQFKVELSASQKLNQQLREWFSGEEARLQRATHFKGELPLFEALSFAFARDAFEKLSAQKNEWLQQALNQPQTVPGHIQPFFMWLVRILSDDGLLVQQPAGTWELKSSDLPEAQQIWGSLLREFPESISELVLSASVGRNLAAMLSGEADSRLLAERLHHNHQSETLYDDSRAYLGTRLAVQNIVQNAVSGWPAHRRLRILEVAVGSAGIVQQLLEVFPANTLDYVIAHADDEGFDRSQAEYAGNTAVVVAKLDDERLGLSADSKIPENFDIIIMRHSLHRTTHPAGVLAAAKMRLARGGLLILAERHPDFIANFVAGLDPQWWRESLDGQPVSPLMSPDCWEHALAEQGFVDIDTFRETASDDMAEGTYLMLAKRPDDDVIAIPEPARATWLLVCEGTGKSCSLTERVGRLLESRGQQVRMASIHAAGQDPQVLSFDPKDPDSITDMLAAARKAMSKVEHFVFMVGREEEDAIPDMMHKENARITDLLNLVQILGQSVSPPKLWLVSAGGALADDMPGSHAASPAQGAMWGFGRVIMNEYPGLDCTLIDTGLDLEGEKGTANRLQMEFLQPDGENEIVLSPRGRYALRMEHAMLTGPQKIDRAPSRFHLDFRVPGQLRNLIWLPQTERAVADDEVEVRVVAAGLNFRDVMYLMGLLPDEAVENGFAGATLGLEFSGVVTRVGKRAGEFEVGDAVMGFGSACFSSHVVTRTNAIIHKPADWTFEAAATVPTVFFTVYYALKHLADLQPGERVLIHGAAGGVGIAAVQLALHIGAEVYATAGSREKRDFVELLGADHVFDSRSLAYADEILAVTGGEGVDVVLNSLSGEAIRRNLAILKPFGRFLELGKRDFFENTSIGLRPFKDNITYFAIDADQLLTARPKLAGKLFRELMAVFREGALFPLPHRVFPATHIVDAFRTMQQSRQIGKVVVKLDGAQVHIEPGQSAVPPLKFKKDSAWLVTGGISGFGLESARWLAERGAGCLVLAGRRGIRTPGAADAILELESLGARIKVIACDIGDRESAEAMLAEIRRDCPPLSGVLHAAMVLDDGLIANLDEIRFNAVLAPKMLGAWHLHNLTLDIPLDHFVLYSSVTTFLGNPGQANYVAANAALERLAALRQSMGLPAITIGWGPIGDAGYLTRNQEVKDSLTARLGATPLNARDALDVLDRLLVQDRGTVAVSDLNWPTLARILPSARGPRFETLRRQSGSTDSAETSGEDILALIEGKSPDEVRSIVQSMVVQQVSQILCVSADRIEPARSLLDLGMDSLMGVELALGLEERFQIQLPAMLLNEGPTVERISQRITERMLGNNDQAEERPGNDMNVVMATLVAQHGEAVTSQVLAQASEDVREMIDTGERLSS